VHALHCAEPRCGSSAQQHGKVTHDPSSVWGPCLVSSCFARSVAGHEGSACVGVLAWLWQDSQHVRHKPPRARACRVQDGGRSGCCAAGAAAVKLPAAFAEYMRCAGPLTELSLAPSCARVGDEQPLLQHGRALFCLAGSRPANQPGPRQPVCCDCGSQVALN
jgi:hypothetical protein